MKKIRVLLLLLMLGACAVISFACGNVALKSISVSAMPKIVYVEGEFFDGSQMIVEAQYSDGTSEIVADYIISKTGALTIDDKIITISYTKGAITKSVDIDITVVADSAEEPIAVEINKAIDIDGDKYFVFTPDESGSYRLYSQGGGSPILTVYNSDDELIASDFSTSYSPDKNFSFCFGFKQGTTYYLRVYFNDEHNGGGKMFIEKYIYPQLQADNIAINLEQNQSNFELVAGESGYYRIYSQGCRLKIYDKDYGFISDIGSSGGVSETVYLNKGESAFIVVWLLSYGGGSSIGAERRYVIEASASQGGEAKIGFWGTMFEQSRFILGFGTEITLTATSRAGYVFAGWFNGETLVSAQAEYIFLLPASDLNLEARFFFTGKYDLTVSDSDGGTVSTVGGKYSAGTDVTLIATPLPDYAFDGWYEGERKESSSATYILNMPSRDISLVARFTFYQSGNGTKTNPFIIATKGQLLYFAENVNTVENYSQNKYFALGAHISLNNTEWQMIGLRQGSVYNAFTGEFDGRGYMVSDFKITQSNAYSVGFFGYSYGVIKNFGVKNFIIDLAQSNAYCVGGLVGENSTYGVISKCFAIGSVSLASANWEVRTGGLVGENSGLINNSYAVCDVAAANSSGSVLVGGLIGQSYGEISYCYALGNVTMNVYSNGRAGGLVGQTHESIINSFAAGNISATTQDSICLVGGLVGAAYSHGPVNCYRFQGQSFYVNLKGAESFSPNNDLGEVFSAAELNDPSFFSGKLLFNETIWDLSTLPPAFATGGTPTEPPLEGYDSGSGKETDPYVIKTPDQLNYLATQVNSGDNYSKDLYFVIGANIDLGGVEWTPIGYLYGFYFNADYSKTFQGNLDGGGYEVSNFKIRQANLHVNSFDNKTFAGLFGFLYNAAVKNLDVVDFDISFAASRNDGVFMGGLAAQSINSNISACYANGTIWGYAYSAGGLAGNVSGGVITQCRAIINVQGEFAGGLVGINNGTIENCFAEGVVFGKSSATFGSARAGGLVGQNSHVISNSYALCEVKVDVSHEGRAGGLAGLNSGSISKCYAGGSVTGLSYVNYLGGFVAKNDGDGVISDCYSVADVSADNNCFYAGGFAGENWGNILRCYSAGNVMEGIDIYSTYSSNFAYSGGFAGILCYGKIEDCFAYGNVFAASPSQCYAGGLVGMNNEGTITNCYSFGGQEFYRKTDDGVFETANVNEGLTCNESQLASQTFYVSVLKWSDAVWNLNNLDIPDKKLPRLY